MKIVKIKKISEVEPRRNKREMVEKSFGQDF